jgi:cation:H+ antiporter
LILIPFVFLKVDINRIWGVALFALYLTYLVVVLI